MANLLQSVFIGTILIVLVLIFIFLANQSKLTHDLSSQSNRELRIENVFNGSRIPRVLHYTYMHELLPVEYRDLIRSCLMLNPNVTFVFWTDKDAYDLVEKHFPDRLEVYKSYIKGEGEKLKKSDLIRPLILHRYGGVYMDLDTRCQKPLAPVLNKDSCIVSTDVDVKIGILFDMEFILMNSFMACIPRHHFFGFVIDSMVKNDRGFILSSTGPFILTKLYAFYRRVFLSSPDTSRDLRYQIAVGDWRIFSPHLNPNLNNFCGEYRNSKKTPQTPKERGCHLLQRYLDQHAFDSSNATVIHLFIGLGYSKHIGFIRKTFNINFEFPRIVKASTYI